MKVLLVNAHRGANRDVTFKDTYNTVQKALGEFSNTEILVKGLDDLREYIHAQKQEGNVISDVAMRCARELFDEFDPDGSGSMDSEELVPLLVKMLGFLGTFVSPERREKLEYEAEGLVEEFDADGSGELDFEEFIAMLSCDPWYSLLPTDTKADKAAQRAIQNFCALDLIVVDGDPNLLPWHDEARDLLHLVYQVLYSQHWKDVDRVALLGTKCVTQMVHCLECSLHNDWKASGVSKITSVVDVQRTIRELNQKGPVEGLAHALCSDDRVGQCMAYDSAGQRWIPSFNIGLVRTCHRHDLHSRPRFTQASGRHPIIPGTEESVGARVTVESAHAKHEVLRDFDMSFYAPSDRESKWDLVTPDGSSKMTLLAFSNRGGAVYEAAAEVILCTTFSLSAFFPSMVTMVRNFARKHYQKFKTGLGNKKRGFAHWMEINGEVGKLSLDKLANTRGLAEQKVENPEIKKMARGKPFTPSTPRGPRCLEQAPRRMLAPDPALLRIFQEPAMSKAQIRQMERQVTTAARTAIADGRTMTSLPRLRRRTRKDCTRDESVAFCKHKLYEQRRKVMPMTTNLYQKDPEIEYPELYQDRLQIKRREENEGRSKWLYGDLKFNDTTQFDPLKTTSLLDDPYATKPVTANPYTTQFDLDRCEARMNRQAFQHGPFRFHTSNFPKTPRSTKMSSLLESPKRNLSTARLSTAPMTARF